MMNYYLSWVKTSLRTYFKTTKIIKLCSLLTHFQYQNKVIKIKINDLLFKSDEDSTVNLLKNNKDITPFQ